MKILTVTSRSATFELDSNEPYYCNLKFQITLNGVVVREENRNVFSLFGLSPKTSYEICACGQSVKFSTLDEHSLIDVRSFGAQGDGVHDDTEAFATAIACLKENFTLFVPDGIYFIKPIFLKSNMTLWLSRGAKLLGNPDRSAYPVLPANLCGENFGTWQGEEADCFASLITAIGQTNIKIIGDGVIDCNALAGDWYENHRVMRGAWRPRGIFLNRCGNILIQGLTVKNTPSWNIHPYFCHDVKLYDLLLENIPSMPTTDGIDPDCSNGVEIVGVKISVGDDCIALKSGTLELAKKYKTPCENIIIRNCLMCEGHGGVVFGSELSGGIRNVAVSQCLFDGTDRGLRIKTRRGRGRLGECGKVSFNNIIMKDVKVPFVINMYYNMGDENGHTEYVWTTEKLPVDERTPIIGSFAFRNMNCSGVGYSAGAFYGLPESPIKCVELENVTFSYNKNSEYGFADMREKNIAVKNQGLDFHFVEEVILKNVKLKGQDGEEVLLEYVGKYSRN